jgi:hypothetical protein
MPPHEVVDAFDTFGAFGLSKRKQGEKEIHSVVQDVVVVLYRRP